ncbi:MAG TPA: Crp/Fnr family transcriptional regulator [Rhizomicrobium sp.]
MTLPHERSRNHLLMSLPDDAWNRIALMLESIRLPAHQALETHGRDVEWIYFVESGIASVITESAAGDQVESGIVGRDGMTGPGVALGDGTCAQTVVVQIAGSALRAPVPDFRKALEDSASLRAQALLFARAFAIQTAHTALANGAGVLEQRLARWLLMLHDRLDGDVLAITHDYIAIMLSVRRPGVSVALKELEGKGLIRSRRGAIEIVDRGGLLERSGGLYGRTEEEYRRLLGWRSARIAD